MRNPAVIQVHKNQKGLRILKHGQKTGWTACIFAGAFTDWQAIVKTDLEGNIVPGKGSKAQFEPELYTSRFVC